MRKTRSKSAYSDEQVVELIETHGARVAAETMGVGHRGLLRRRRKIELKLQRRIRPPQDNQRFNPSQSTLPNHPHRIQLHIADGVVLIGSDAHYWPGEPSVAHRAFVKFCRALAPFAVVLNGDVMDCARISPHPPVGGEKRPRVIDELETAQERTHEIALAAPEGAHKIWTLGNHDAWFETRLAAVAPDYEHITGMHLRDHFAAWVSCWSVFVNDDVVIKHRHRSGIHSTHNSPLWAGRTTVCGHHHSAKVTPFTDYNGTRYGVDTGSLADTDSEAFVDYTEDNPLDRRSGFCVLTFVGGKLLMPELALTWDERRVQFRGRLIEV
jgi:hypothetical protein